MKCRLRKHRRPTRSRLGWFYAKVSADALQGTGFTLPPDVKWFYLWEQRPHA